MNSGATQMECVWLESSPLPAAADAGLFVGAMYETHQMASQQPRAFNTPIPRSLVVARADIRILSSVCFPCLSAGRLGAALPASGLLVS